MVLKAGIWGADMPTAAHFLLRYAYEQTMVSAVWGMHKPPGSSSRRALPD